MKRIAAIGAVMIGLLAIPTAAFASTGGSGPGYGVTVSGYGVTVSVPPGACPRFRKAHPVPVKVKVFKRFKQIHGRKVLACPFPLPRPPKQVTGCRPQTLTFSVSAGSSTMTEVSGPRLSPAEEFTYGGSAYTIMSVNPGASQFTAFVDNALFTSGTTITNGNGVIVCSS